MMTEDKLAALVELMKKHERWYEFAPEDSWRVERDIRAVSGMPVVDFRDW